MPIEKTSTSTKPSLTEGSVVKGITAFAIPLFLGQLLQQLYNMADAWVVGNFADNNAFAAVSSGGSLIFLIIGFFSGISIGSGVIISRYFGAGDKAGVERSIHTSFLLGVFASVISTIVGLLLVPQLLVWMHTPADVLPHQLLYFKIYFGGVTTIILYNICMSIMQALGDSRHPLYYLIFSSITNVILDLIFVAVFHWGVAGAAIATVIAQGLSVILCLFRMCRLPDHTRLDFRKLHFYKNMMLQMLRQGLPAGIQNSVISIGNIAIQTSINGFGADAMSGHGAYSKIEGLVFLPIMSMSMSMPTFISQNLGAGKAERAKKGARFGIISGMIMAEVTGVLFYLFVPVLLRFFISAPESIRYGTIHGRTVALFFCLLAFSHCCAGVMRGCGKSVVPMATMLLCWCGVRLLYVTFVLPHFYRFQTISWAYPLTWTLSTLVFAWFLTKSNWTGSAGK